MARGPYRKYGSARILRDGRVRLSAWTLPGLLPLDFTELPDGNPAERAINVHWYGRLIFLMYLTDDRVESACFDFTLTPDELQNAVAVLRHARNGIERWIPAALEWNQASSTVKKEHPETHRIIPKLLESVRELPVAEQWKKRRREIQKDWARRLEAHPEELAKVPAPWVIASASANERKRPRKPASNKAASVRARGS